MGGPLAAWEQVDSSASTEETLAELDLDVAEYLPASRNVSYYDNRHKWAARYTYKNFTQGASSTQRGEGMFHLVKQRMLGGSPLEQLYDDIGKVENQTMRNLMFQLPRDILRHQNEDLSKSPLIHNLQTAGVAPFLLDIMKSWLARVSFCASLNERHVGVWAFGSRPGAMRW